MKKIKNRIYKNGEYKFKIWEKVIIGIISPIFVLLGAPFSVFFFVFLALITIEILGPFGIFLLLLLGIIFYAIIKSSIDD